MYELLVNILHCTTKQALYCYYNQWIFNLAQWFHYDFANIKCDLSE